ncbi:MAG: GNAT family N-acetyltransferase [Saprospiraceae bacterium]
MDRKGKYIDFCEKHPVPLHVQPHWLDAVCGHEHWDVALALDANGRITGALPYHIVKKWMLNVIKMPPLTDYTAVLFNYENLQYMKPYARMTFEQKVLEALVTQLPRTALFNLQFYPELDNWLPFYWAGFRQTTTYTFRLEELTNLDNIYNNFKSSIRTNIRRASHLADVICNDDVTAFYQLYTRSLERRNVAPPYPFATLQQLDAALIKKQQRTIFFAKSKDSDDYYATLYVAYDRHTAYFIGWGIHSDYKESHALQLLIWEAIQKLEKIVQRIDFCGSVLPSIERMIRGFGGIRRPCYVISKTNNKWLQIASLIMNRNY